MEASASLDGKGTFCFGAWGFFFLSFVVFSLSFAWPGGTGSGMARHRSASPLSRGYSGTARLSELQANAMLSGRMRGVGGGRIAGADDLVTGGPRQSDNRLACGGTEAEMRGDGMTVEGGVEKAEWHRELGPLDPPPPDLWQVATTKQPREVAQGGDSRSRPRQTACHSWAAAHPDHPDGCSPLGGNGEKRCVFAAGRRPREEQGCEPMAGQDDGQRPRDG